MERVIGFPSAEITVREEEVEINRGKANDAECIEIREDSKPM